MNRFSVLLLLAFTSCGSKTPKERLVNIKSDLDYPIYHHVVEKGDTFYVGDAYLKGLCDIAYAIGPSDVAFKKFAHSCECYVNHDTMVVTYGIPQHKEIYINIFQDKFIVDARYETDIRNTYDEGTYIGTYLKIGLDKGNLVLKQNKFLVGDTLYGYLDFQTEKYKRHGEYSFDKYKGPFVCILKEEKKY